MEDELRDLRLQLQQKQAQLDLVHSQGKAEKERLQASLNSIPNGALFHSERDAQTGVLHLDYVSGTWEKMTGVTASDSMANVQKVLENIEPDDLKQLLHVIYNPSGQKFSIEVRYNHPATKQQRWMKISTNPYRAGDHIYSDGFIFDITARKLAEQKVKAEKKRLETLGNHIPNSVLFRFEIERHTKNISLTYAGARWEKITGISADVAMEDINSMFAMIHSDDMPAIMKEIDKCVKTLTALQCEYRITVNGQMRWLQMTSHLREEGDLIITDGIITDITRIKKTEYELKAGKNQLQTIGDNIPGGALFQFIRDVRSAQMRLSYTSATWNEVTGIPADHAKASILNIFDAIHSDDLPVLIQSIEESVQTMNDINMEIRASGQYWLHIVARPRREGTNIIWDGIITNIAERKKIEHELKTEKIRLQNMGDNIPAGSLYQFTRDKRTRQMRMSYVSASWEAVTGITAEETLKDILKVFSNIQHSEYKPFMEAIDESERTMSDFRQETRLDNRWLQWFSRPRREDKIIVWDGIIMNTTAHKEAEAELQQYRKNLEVLVQQRTDELSVTNEELAAANEELTALNEELEATNEELKRYQTELETMVEERTQELVLARDKAQESDRLKSAFLANMSHEIRTPVNGIVGMIQFLDSDNLTPACRREYIDVINNSSTQLTKIIDDIIDISKIEAKLLNMNPVPVRLNELMNEMRLFFETFLLTKGKGHIELMIDNSGFIDDCFICVDAVRFRQVITNLMGNATKFTDKGYIRFGYHQSAPDVLEFMVEDSGIGLSDSQINFVFDRFFQANLDNRVYGGTGLGLSISRSLAQMMGGDMWVKSSIDSGSTFYFSISYLPVAPEDEHILAEIPAKRALSDMPFAGKTVLLAEPVPMKSIYYEKLISATGATVIKADSPEECSDRLAQFDHFNIVIADATLFDKEKPDQICRMMNVCANSPVAAIVSDKKQIAGRNLCHTFIEQPVDYAKILKVLEEFAK